MYLRGAEQSIQGVSDILLSIADQPLDHHSIFRVLQVVERGKAERVGGMAHDVSVVFPREFPCEAVGPRQHARHNLLGDGLTRRGEVR